LGLAGIGFEATGDRGWDLGEAMDAGLEVEASGDRTSPASCIAASSSAFVGSLIGVFVRDASGEEDADCLPHKAVALFTEAKDDLSGVGSSFTGVT
jgi:hypothetical protein